VGTGTWSVISGSATITDTLDPISAVTGLTIGDSATLRWTIASGSCPNSTDDITIAVDVAPTTSNAGADQDLCNVTTATLAANMPAVGTAAWSVISGTAVVTDTTDSASGVTGLTIGAASTLRWTIDNGVCPGSADDIVILSRTFLAANAGADQDLCDDTTTTLAANTATVGVGTWSIISGPGAITDTTDPTSALTGLAIGDTSLLKWTIVNGSCVTSTDDISITVYEVPTVANAGPDQDLCDSTTTILSANTPTIGSGTWSLISGSAVVTDTTNPTSGVTGLTPGTAFTLRWTISNGTCISSTDDIQVISRILLAANAGTDQTLCNATATTLTANVATVGTGTWSVLSGTAIVTDTLDPASGTTGLTVGDSSILRWTITNGSCGSSTDDIVVTSVNPPLVNAGLDQIVC